MNPRQSGHGWAEMTGRVLLPAILAAAAVLRFRALGSEGLWVDEAYTSVLTRGSLREILNALSMDDAPPLYYLMQKPILALFGRSEFALRMLSAASGTALAAALFWAGSAVSRRVGWMSAVLAAASVVAVFYSRQARSYALVQLLAALLLACSLRLRRKPGAGMAALFWALSMGLIYSHNLGALVTAAGWLVIIGPVLRPGRSRRIGLYLLAASALGAIPWLMNLQMQSSVHSAYNEWMRVWWDQGRPILTAPLLSWGIFINGSAGWLAPPIHLAGLKGIWVALLWLIIPLAIFGLGRAMITLVRTHPTGRKCTPVSTGMPGTDLHRDGILCALSFSLVPTVGLLLISAVIAPAYVLGRTDTPALPGFLLLLAIGWSLIRPAWTGRTACLLWVIAGLISLTAFAPRHKGADRALAAWIGRDLGPKDALVFSGLTRPTVEHYALEGAWWSRLAWSGAFPPVLDENPAGLPPIPTESAPALMEKAVDLRNAWEKEGIDTVWILAMRSTEGGDPAALRLHRPWPGHPQEPQPDRSLVSAAEIAFPANLVVASLAGLNPVQVRLEYRQDWVSGLRLLLRVPSETWVPADSIPEIEVAG